MSLLPFSLLLRIPGIKHDVTRPHYLFKRFLQSSVPWYCLVMTSRTSLFFCFITAVTSSENINWSHKNLTFECFKYGCIPSVFPVSTDLLDHQPTESWMQAVILLCLFVVAYPIVGNIGVYSTWWGTLALFQLQSWLHFQPVTPTTHYHLPGSCPV